MCVAFFRCLFSVPTTRRAAAVSKHTTLTWENVRNHHIPTTLESLSLSYLPAVPAFLPASNYRSIDFHLWRHPGMCVCVCVCVQSNNGGGPFFFFSSSSSLFLLLRLLCSFLIFSSRFFSGGPFLKKNVSICVWHFRLACVFHFLASRPRGTQWASRWCDHLLFLSPRSSPVRVLGPLSPQSSPSSNPKWFCGRRQMDTRKREAVARARVRLCPFDDKLSREEEVKPQTYTHTHTHTERALTAKRKDTRVL